MSDDLMFEDNKIAYVYTIIFRSCLLYTLNIK